MKSALKNSLLIVCMILIVSFCIACTCSIKSDDTKGSIDLQNSGAESFSLAESNPEEYASAEKSTMLEFVETFGEYARYKLVDPEFHKIQLHQDINIWISKWNDEKGNTLLLPLLTYLEDGDWCVSYIGEKAVLLNDPTHIESNGNVFSPVLQKIGELTLFSAASESINENPSGEQLNDNQNSKAVTLSYEELGFSNGDGSWLFLQEIKGSDYLGYSTLDQFYVDICLILREDIPEDYCLSFGDEMWTFDAICQGWRLLDQSRDG